MDRDALLMADTVVSFLAPCEKTIENERNQDAKKYNFHNSSGASFCRCGLWYDSEHKHEHECNGDCIAESCCEPTGRQRKRARQHERERACKHEHEWKSQREREC